MKKTRMAAILAALSLSVGGTVAGAGSANAAAGERHFIHISTHAIPSWRAKAQLYNGKGELVYSWKQDTRVGGRALWYFTDGGDYGWIDVQVEGSWSKINKQELPLGRDHCFNVSSGGDVHYTGDNVTGDCTNK